MAAPPIPDRPNLSGTNPASDDTIPDVNGRGPDYLDLTWPGVVGATSYDAQITTSSGVRTVDDVEPGVRLNGLQPNTPYVLEVRSKNNDGASDWSPSRDAFTRPPTPGRPFLDGTSPASNDPRPQDVLTDRPLSRGSDSLKIKWRPITGVNTFEIEINGGTPSVARSGDRHSGLSANSLHKFRVRSLGAGGKSFWSDNRDVFTRPLRPNPPFLVNTITIRSDPIPDTASRGPDFLQMQWDRGYAFDRFLLQGDAGTPVTKRFADVDHVFRGFAPNTSHGVRMRVADDAQGGLSFWSEASEYRTRPPTVRSFTRGAFNPLPRGVAVQWSAVGAFNEDDQAKLRVVKVSTSGEGETVTEIQQPEATKSGNAIDLFLPASGTLTYFSIIGVGRNSSFKSAHFTVDVSDIPTWGYDLLGITPSFLRPRAFFPKSNSGSIVLNFQTEGTSNNETPESGSKSDSGSESHSHSESQSQSQPGPEDTHSNEEHQHQPELNEPADSVKKTENDQTSVKAEGYNFNTSAARPSAATLTGSDASNKQQTSSNSMLSSPAKPVQTTQDPIDCEQTISEPAAPETPGEAMGKQIPMSPPRIYQCGPAVQVQSVTLRDGTTVVKVEMPNTEQGIKLSAGEKLSFHSNKDGSSAQLRIEKVNTRRQGDYEQWDMTSDKKGQTEIVIHKSVNGQELEPQTIRADAKNNLVRNFTTSTTLSKPSYFESTEGKAPARSGIKSEIAFHQKAQDLKTPVKQVEQEKSSPRVENKTPTSPPEKAQIITKTVSDDRNGGNHSISMTNKATNDAGQKSRGATPEKGLGDKQDRLIDRSMETNHLKGTPRALVEEVFDTTWISDGFLTPYDAARNKNVGASLFLYFRYLFRSGDMTLKQLDMITDIRSSPITQSVLNRFHSQIDAKAKKDAAKLGPGSYKIEKGEKGYTFERDYDFKSLLFALGRATLSGEFSGTLFVDNSGGYTYSGQAVINFKDDFTDPYDLLNKYPGVWNPDGEPYQISGSWIQPYSR